MAKQDLRMLLVFVLSWILVAGVGFKWGFIIAAPIALALCFAMVMRQANR